MVESAANKVGRIVINNIPSKYACSKIVSDLLTDLPDIAVVQIPSNSTLGFISRSQNAPDPAEVFIWISEDGTGAPLAINYFLDSAWRPIKDIRRTPSAWWKGDWLAEKEKFEKDGFTIMDGSFGTTDITHLFKELGTGTPQNYSIFAVAFVGRQIIPTSNP